MLEYNNVWEASAIYFQMGHNHPPTWYVHAIMQVTLSYSPTWGRRKHRLTISESSFQGVSETARSHARQRERERLIKRNLEKQLAGFWNIFFITWLLDRPSSNTLSLFVDAIGISSQLCLPLSTAGPPKTLLNPGKSTRKLPLRALADSDLDFQQSRGDVRFVHFCFASILILKDSMGSNSAPHSRSESRSWQWFQPIPKNMRQLANLPQTAVRIVRTSFF